jgi:hypothetical protein
MEKIMKYALIDALGTAAYIIIVAFFISSIGNFAGQDSPDKGVLIPIAMLMLLVLSVAIVGSLIFGRPVMWYIDGKKKEALNLLGWTLGIFFVLTVLVFALMISFW